MRTAKILRTILFCFFIFWGLACDNDDDITDPGASVPERIELVDGDKQMAVVGRRSPSSLVVRVLSKNGLPVERVQVIFSVAQGDASVEKDVVATDPSGIALTFINFGRTAGQVIVKATAPGLQGSPVTFNLMALAETARIIQVFSGNDQTYTVGQTLPKPIVAVVTDMYANPVARVSVTFAVTAGNGTLSAANVATNDSGRASTQWTLGTLKGFQRVEARGTGLAGFAAVFSARAVADAPVKVNIVSGDNQGGEIGKSLDQNFVVKVADQYDNGVENIAVSFRVVAGNGSLSNTAASTDGNGLASTKLTLGTSGNQNSVQASAPNLAPVTFQAKGLFPTTLRPPTKSIDKIGLTWSRNRNPGFKSFELYRSTSAGVTRNSTLLVNTTNEADTSYADDKATPGQKYFYRLYANFNDNFSLPSNEVTVEAGISVELGDNGFDLELDTLRQQLYVSVPARNQVVIISTRSYQIINRVTVGSRPYGIDLSLDGTLLFVALNQAGAVAYLDLNTLAVREVDVAQQLGHSLTYDVAEAKPNRVFVTASPSSGGFAYIAMIKRDQNNQAIRVASDRIIRAEPVLAPSPDGSALYIGEGFSPNSLYKLDLSKEEAPIILEDDHGSVSGTDYLEVSPDGLRIYLYSGQVLRTGSFNQAGRIGVGVPKLNGNGSLCFVGKSIGFGGGSGGIEIYDTTTFLKTGEIPLAYSVSRLEILPNAAGAIILNDDLVHGVSLKR